MQVRALKGENRYSWIVIDSKNMSVLLQRQRGCQTGVPGLAVFLSSRKTAICHILVEQVRVNR